MHNVITLVLLYIILMYPAHILIKTFIYPFARHNSDAATLIIDTILWPIILLTWMVGLLYAAIVYEIPHLCRKLYMRIFK